MSDSDQEAKRQECLRRQRECMRAKYAADPEAARARQRAYRQAHLEEMREYDRKRTVENGEVRRAQARARRAADPDGHREREKKYLDSNREKNRAYQRAQYEKHRDSERARVRAIIWARNGWTPEDVERAWNDQGGCCAMCRRVMVRTGRVSHAASADHDHQTGEKRDLICRRCNTALGYYEKHRENIDVYVSKWSALRESRTDGNTNTTL